MHAGQVKNNIANISMTVKYPLVSIIITTKNEEKNIGNCLESILRNIELKGCRNIGSKFLNPYTSKSLKPYIEIIVVDNNSSDRTKEIARKYTKKVYNFGPERSAQRNFGAKKARGKYLLFLDADMILSSTVIKEVIKKFKFQNSKSKIDSKLKIQNSKQNFSNFKHQTSNTPLVALYIPEIVLGDSFWSKVRRFERSFYDGTVIDCVRAVRKDIFEKVGGFDTSLTGPEDWDFDKKVRKQGKVTVLTSYDFEEIGKKLSNRTIEQLNNLTNQPVIYHNEAEFNLKRYLAKKLYYAKSFEKYVKKWGENDPDIKKQFGFWYRYFGVFLENGKWKRFLGHPILAAGVYFLRGLVGGAYIFSKIFKK
jgi:glycosyltransferase involved in cell wall biosynthesis